MGCRSQGPTSVGNGDDSESKGDASGSSDAMVSLAITCSGWMLTHFSESLLRANVCWHRAVLYVPKGMVAIPYQSVPQRSGVCVPLHPELHEGPFYLHCLLSGTEGVKVR